MIAGFPTRVEVPAARWWGAGPLFEAITDAVVVVDAASERIMLWNQGAAGLFQYTSEEAASLRVDALLPPSVRAIYRTGLEAFRETGVVPLIDGAPALETAAVRKDGGEIRVQLTLSRIYSHDDPDGRHFVALVRDVTGLRQSQRILELILESSGQPTLAHDLDGLCTLANRSAEELFGYPNGALIGRNLHETLHHSKPDGTPFPAEECASLRHSQTGTSERSTDVFWRADGTSVPVEYRSEPILGDGTLLGAVVTIEDITERLRSQVEAAERELLLLGRVTTDALTGVGNRLHADELIDSLLPGDAVVMLDVDHFKQINDTRGHAEGDRVLVDLAAFLSRQIREQDGLARYGGEEFLLVLRQAHVSAEAMMERLGHGWSQLEPGVTFSAGLAVYGGDDRKDCVRSADLRLLEAKRQGRNRVVSHDRNVS